MRSCSFKLLLLSLFTFSQIIFSQSAFLDMSFGLDGVVRTSGLKAKIIYIQSDGKILVGGEKVVNNYPDYIIYRFNTDRSIDSNFGVNGCITEILEGSQSINGITQTPDGKILAVINNQKYYIVTIDLQTIPGFRGPFTFMKLNSNGSKDMTFGVNGKKNFSFDSTLYTGASTSKTMKFTNDGKIFIGGQLKYIAAGPGGIPMGKVLRITSDIEKDNTFNITASQSSSIIDCSDLIVLNDGSIITLANVTINTFLVKYPSGGTIDNSFGNNGYITVSSFKPTMIQLLQNSKILLSGYTTSNKEATQVRFNINGSIDTSYGNAGTLSFSNNSVQQEYAFGSLLINNNYSISGLQTWSGSYDLDLAITNLQGNIITSIGNNGHIPLSMTGNQTLTAITQQTDAINIGSPRTLPEINRIKL